MIIVLILSAATTVSAAPPRQTDLGVDHVMLKAGTRLAGSVVNKSSDGTLTIAVRREWLRNRTAAFFEKQLRLESEVAKTALAKVLERTSQWQTQRAKDERLSRFLDKETERLKVLFEQWSQGEPEDPPRFMLVDVPTALIDTMFVQPAVRKQVAFAAWAENLADVESRPVTKLAAELRERGIDFEKQPVDLSAELPPRPEDDRQWAARQAVIEYHLRKSLAFQGTADLLVRTDDPAAAPDVSKLFGELLKSQLESQLADLFGEPGLAAKPRPDANRGQEALQAAQQTADKEDATGFRATRLFLQPGNKSVSVEGSFLARMPDGSWLTIWQHKETLDASRPRPDVEKELRDNEQVKKVLDLAGGLGTAEEQITQALRFGATTMAAQETVNARFSDFFDRYAAKVDGPPIWFK